MKQVVRLAGCLSLLTCASIVNAYEIIQVDSGGSLSGTIRLEGEMPVQQTTIIGKDNHICGDGNAVMNPVVVGDDNGLANVVVHITAVASGKDWPADQTNSIVQEDCQFSPYVQVMKKDQTVKIINEDPLLHNIHTYEIIGRARRTMFNIAQPRAGQVDEQALKLRRGHVVEVACDAHNWMSAWIYTSEHPYYSVTDSAGAYNIADIPAGEYEIQIWHPTLGSFTRNVSVTANKSSSLDVALTAEVNQQ